jgi:predicted DNA-binding transcriptional regulator AlpA
MAQRHTRTATDAPTTPVPDRLLTLRQVQAILTISRSTVWRMTRDGELRAVRLTPTRIAYRASDIARLIDERTGARG